MSSTIPSTDSVLTRYRSVALTLAGVSAAYAIYYIHKTYISADDAQQSSTNLQRHGAVRHHRTSRPRRRTSSAPEARVRVEAATTRLQEREEAGERYGTIQIIVEGASRPFESDLLPSRIPSVSQIESSYAASREEARELHRRVEDAFVDSFLPEAFVGRTISQLEEQYLRIALRERGIGYDATSAGIGRFNDGQRPVSRAGLATSSRTEREGGELDTQNWLPADQLLGWGDGEETIADDESEEWRVQRPSENTGAGQAQGLQNLVYNIAKEQAVREGYVHRGVSCNSCGTLPIRGIRYRCANCNDYDLCEDCEAAQVHTKTHIFLKVRIPAPFLGNGRSPLPVWYPGKPNQMIRSVPKSLAARLRAENDLETQDIDALWDEFSCLAATEWAEDPNWFGMAIDRKTFDKCFVPATSLRPPPPNLVYDRIFAFYDTNEDGLIGFEEFVQGVAALMNTTRDERLKRIFKGYDLDNDGFVSRRDFLRLFRAWFVIQKELTRDALAGIEEEFFTEGGVKDIVMSSQPISSAFPGPIPEGIPSRSGMGKSADDGGDMVIVDGQGPLRDDSEPAGDRYENIADARRPRTNELDAHLSSGAMTWARHDSVMSGDDSPGFMPHRVDWPPDEDDLTETDIVSALGRSVPMEEIMDPVDRARVVHAMETRLDLQRMSATERDRQTIIDERWRRRHFYTDQEEGASTPPGYHESDSSDDEDPQQLADQRSSVSNSRPPSPRSRSSSKVRFEDSVTDTEYETRSNTSSRSVPVGERWGGYELTEPEKDVGKDLLYLSVQQGFNEMLDELFKEKEDLAMAAMLSKRNRDLWRKEIVDYEARQAHGKGKEEAQTQPTAPEQPPLSPENPKEKPLEKLLEETGYSIVEPAADTSENDRTEQDGPAPSAAQSTAQDDSRSIINNEDIDIRHPIIDPALRNLPVILSTAEPQRRRSTRSSPLQQVESASTASEVMETSHNDPTLPQFRPNSPEPSTTETSATPIPTPPSPLHDNPAARAQLDYMPSIEPYPDNTILSVFSKHDAYEREVESRNGKDATLSYEEFVRKMVGKHGYSPFGQGDASTGNVSGKDLQDLMTAGELGNLGFVGSWIEMFPYRDRAIHWGRYYMSPG